MPLTSRSTAISRSGASMATRTATATCRSIFAGDQLLCARLAPPTWTGQRARSMKFNDRDQYAPSGRGYASSCAARGRLPRGTDRRRGRTKRGGLPFGMAGSSRLQKIIGKQMHKAELLMARPAKRPVLPNSTTRPARAGRGGGAWSQRPKSGRGRKPALRRYLAGRR